MGKVVGSFEPTQHPAQCIHKYLLVEKTHQHNIDSLFLRLYTFVKYSYLMSCFIFVCNYVFAMSNSEGICCDKLKQKYNYYAITMPHYATIIFEGYATHALCWEKLL